MSRPGVKENVWEIEFDPTTVSGIFIKWVADKKATEYNV
jgi:hypothetical protein